ncbi:ATP-binding cassette sub-family C member 5-like [Diadema antillarum]|uniref:ATP-binding cassette sub-family C member 5-like n=1 Tax=Diadema antillarum TaxID=105358 RepID=UPI003A8A2BD0
MASGGERDLDYGASTSTGGSGATGGPVIPAIVIGMAEGGGGDTPDLVQSAEGGSSYPLRGGDEGGGLADEIEEEEEEAEDNGGFSGGIHGDEGGAKEEEILDDGLVGRDDAIPLVAANGQAPDSNPQSGSSPEGASTDVTFSPSADEDDGGDAGGKYQKMKQRHPLNDASIISILYFHWLNFAFYKAWKKGLKKEDLFPCTPEEQSLPNHERFARLWEEELAKRGREKASVGRVIFKFMFFRVILGSSVMMLALGCSLFAAAYIVKHLLEYVQQTETDLQYGLLWVMGLFLCQLTQVTLLSFQFYLNTRSGTRLRAAVVSTIYRRAISVRTLRGKSAGEIINLCTNDGQRLYEMGLWCPTLICGPPLAVAGIVYTYFLIGPAALLGTGTFFLFYPITMAMAKLVALFRRQAVSVTDKRVRLMNEVVASIKLIKMYAWEMPFSDKIAHMRADEQRALEKGGYIQSLSTMALPIVPVIASMLTLTLHTALGNNLTPAEAFSYMACLTALRIILVMSPLGIKAVSESMVAFPRIKELLLMEDIKPYTDKPQDPSLAVEIKAATFAWDKEQTVDSGGGKKGGRSASKDAGAPGPSGSKGAGTSRKGSAGATPNGVESGIPLVKNGGEGVVFEEGEDGKGEEEIVRTLFDINLSMKKGSLLGVCGGVGSGKSSLINAVLSHMIKTDGSVAVDGKFAYVPQQACIFNTTLRENILFGLDFDNDRYVEVIEACGLAPDLEILANGDLTEIGERGINLSGGQKQRISIARAVYSQRDIYLLDDPLSAVDAHVGQHIFENVIKKLLVGRTVLFVTHQLQYLNQCDRVLFMKGGRIFGDGPHSELMQSSPEYNGLIQNFLKEHEMEVETDERDLKSRSRALSSMSLRSLDFISRTESFRSITKSFRARSNQLLRDQSVQSIPEQTPLPVRDAKNNMPKKHTDGSTDDEDFLDVFASLSGDEMKDIDSYREDEDEEEEVWYDANSEDDDEEIEEEEADEDEEEVFDYDGKLSKAEETTAKTKPSRTYREYVRAAGGFLVSGLVILTFVLSQGCSTFSNLWLSHWLEQGNGTKVSLNLSKSDSPQDQYEVANISDNPHLRFYQLVYAASVVGCVLFGMVRAYSYVKTTLRAASRIHNSVFVNVIHTPMSFFDTTPSGQILNRFSKDLDEADIRLPFVMESLIQNGTFMFFNICTIIYIFPWFLIAITAMLTVFGFLNRFYRPGLRGIKMLDNTLRSPWFSHVTSSMNSLSTVHAYGKKEEFIAKFDRQLDAHSVPLMLFMMANRWLATRFDIMTVCLGVVTALSIVLTHGKTPPGLAGLAITFTMQVLGIFQFTMRLAAEVEARFTSVQRIIDYTNLPREAPPTIKDKEPPAKWPEHGRIVFRQVKMRYRDNLPLVLKGVTFIIRPREKIGIVGRTGSGKSSLGVALFRLSEVAGGSITIDQLDIGVMGLRDVRSKISIIPQDPVLFVGTVRYNLDPFNERTDEEVWMALERTHMKNTISRLDQQLMAPVVENGENFSVGERQLICMARALLRNSKILFLDEATAAIDSETDSLIQATIREAFRDCTMLTIAHRLNTIVDSHRIMVMDNGKIVEFDRPAALMSKQTSIFKSMMEAVGAQKELAEVFGSTNQLQIPS